MTRMSSLADQLFVKLEQQIRSGAVPPGSRLPTQKEIALEQDVSRTVVREAMARLEACGLAVPRQGSGIYVSETARYKPFQITRDELHELADVIKLLEMRLAVEAEMAAFAAARRTTANIGEMREALRRMAESTDDPAAAAEADAAFHLAIARATQNEYYVRLVEFIGVRLVPPRSLYLRDQPEAAHRAYADRVLAEHEAIIDPIARMDPRKARAAARKHMEESLHRHTKLSDQFALQVRPEGNGAVRRPLTAA